MYILHLTLKSSEVLTLSVTYDLLHAKYLSKKVPFFSKNVSRYYFLVSQYRSRESIVIEHVCLSVYTHISGTTCPNWSKFSVHVTCGLILMWQCSVMIVMYSQFSG